MSAAFNKNTALIRNNVEETSPLMQMLDLDQI